MLGCKLETTPINPNHKLGTDPSGTPIDKGRRFMHAPMNCHMEPVTHILSIEAEFRAIALGICELMWFNTLLKELYVKVDEPMRLYCDKKEKIDEGVICTPFVASKSQLADVFTKASPSNIYSPLIDKLGMLDIFEPGAESPFQNPPSACLSTAKLSQAAGGPPFKQLPLFLSRTNIYFNTLIESTLGGTRTSSFENKQSVGLRVYSSKNSLPEALSPTKITLKGSQSTSHSKTSNPQTTLDHPSPNTPKVRSDIKKGAEVERPRSPKEMRGR
ncbi:hypothetical protein CK203_076167 [Vitis vinifera]|uniref:Uncharacterized protein n=1 Tax=Vitis vinifera TaxID=29760 RepID=A0A438EEE9_VITVI|nr:hypothetical protein CK203_076167 [Vitis vinifera]